MKFSYPDGLDVEVFNYKTLIKSQNLSKSKSNKEHVTSYIRKSKKFKKFNLENRINYSNRRWTLDNLEDYLFLKRVVNYFYPKNYFSWTDLIKAEKKNKNLKNIYER